MTGARPRHGWFVEQQCRTASGGLIEMRPHAVFDFQESGIGFKHDVERVRHSKAWPALRRGGGRKIFNRQSVLVRRESRTGDRFAIRQACEHQAALPKQLLLRFGFEVRPQVVGSQQQRHIVGVLEVCLANDPRFAVRAALIVSRAEAVEAKHSQTAPREVIRRSAAEAADSQHDYIEHVCHASPFVTEKDRS